MGSKQDRSVRAWRAVALGLVAAFATSQVFAGFGGAQGGGGGGGGGGDASTWSESPATQDVDLDGWALTHVAGITAVDESNLNITGYSGGSGVTGRRVAITGGNGHGISGSGAAVRALGGLSNGAGGDVNAYAGNGTTGRAGGNVLAAGGSGHNGAGSGGELALTGGDSGGAGGEFIGTGGNGATGQPGGDARLVAGTGDGGNDAGASVIARAGDGAGTPGVVDITGDVDMNGGFVTETNGVMAPSGQDLELNGGSGANVRLASDLDADGRDILAAGAIYHTRAVVTVTSGGSLADADLMGQVYALNVSSLTDHTLSDAPVGSHATWIVTDTDGWRVYAAAGDTLRISGTVTATGGGLTSTALGSSMTLVKVSADAWIAVAAQGTWSTVAAP